ncbi:hypothetical protein BC629DRAFT_1563330 [Irpex lacteus]|nr:hypothetical protein BC629DRAFT_1563330 [Irpex lacteus]
MAQPVTLTSRRGPRSESGAGVASSAPSLSYLDMGGHHHKDTGVQDYLLPSDSAYDNEKLYGSSLVLRGARISYHPFVAILLAVWIILVVVVVTLFERTVALSPTTTSLPWYYSTTGLPAILYIVFSQGHGLVTAMYLSRLFVSALDSHRTKPHTWMEMFWIADQNWSGPLGILTTILKMARLRVRVSTAFVVFSFISIVALVTPILLGQAYPVETLDVRVHTTFNPSVLSPTRILGIDAYAQLASGRGSWTTNQTVLSLFSSVSYTPVNQIRNTTSDDMFFTGDVLSRDVLSVPGIRIQGGCQPVDSTALPDFNNNTAFIQYCKQNLDTSKSFSTATKTLGPSSLSLNVSYCADSEFDSTPVPSNTSSFVWYSNSTFNGLLTESVRGLVHCNARASMGRASVYGRSLTYDSYQQDDSLYNVSQAQGGEPIQPPLFGALYALLDITNGQSSISDAQVIDILGFAELKTDNQGIVYKPPSLELLADAIWSGAQHMANAVALLSRDDSTSYPAIEHVSVSGRVRRLPLFITAMALLGIWFLCLLGLTVALWRRTSLGSSFDSYVVGRLLAQRPDLLDGDCSGSPEDNEKLSEPFNVG